LRLWGFIKVNLVIYSREEEFLFKVGNKCGRNLLLC
jgi:hypothetical protein